MTNKLWLCIKCKKSVNFIHWIGLEGGPIYLHCEKCSGIPQNWQSDKYMSRLDKKG